MKFTLLTILFYLNFYNAYKIELKNKTENTFNIIEFFPKIINESKLVLFLLN